jgi:small subunit ribosomal protein S4
MARYTKALCKLCRREGRKLFLKGDRCYTQKCAFEKRSYAPGHRGNIKPKVSEFGIRLREKQVMRRIYGLSEKQFRSYFEKASKSQAITGEKLIELLERRLDNVIFRMGMASSRQQARLLVRHGHVLVNGRKVDIPSYQVKEGSLLASSAKENSRKIFKKNLEGKADAVLPGWLTFNPEALEGKILKLPTRDQVDLQVEENLIVEHYSR